MIEYSERNAKRWSALGERPVFGMTVFEMAKDDPDIMAVVADVTNSAGLRQMHEAFPDRVVNVGIAEQNMMGIATGLASEGYKVVTSTFAPFQSMRCLEQIRVYQGYMRQKLVMVGLLGGLASGYLGHTHCAIEDAAILRAIPNVAVVSPCDCMEVAKAVQAAFSYENSVYIRLLGNTKIPIVHRGDYSFTIGKAMKLHDGDDVAIIAAGMMVQAALKAAEVLAEDGINVAVFNMHTLKPVDGEMLDSLCGRFRVAVTVEEHTVIGGMGSAVAEYLSCKLNAPRLFMMGIRDEYAHGASQDTMLKDYGLTAEVIEDRIRSVLEER